VICDWRFAIFNSPSRSCRAARRRKDSHQFICLTEQLGQFRLLDSAGIDKQLQPEDCLISLFQGYPNLRDKIGPRPARAAIISGHASRRTQDLSAQHTRHFGPGQCPEQADHTQGELLGPLAQFLRPPNRRRGRSRSGNHKSPITNHQFLSPSFARPLSRPRPSCRGPQ
jgi:hypothetical protein